MVGVVQLVRASVCGTECRGFESHYPPHFLLNVEIVWGYSQVGKAPDFDSGMRRFESCYPCHFLLCGPLAQSAEHLTFNQVVPGSTPGWLTIKKRLNHAGFSRFCFSHQYVDFMEISLLFPLFSVNRYIDSQ